MEVDSAGATGSGQAGWWDAGAAASGWWGSDWWDTWRRAEPNLVADTGMGHLNSIMYGKCGDVSDSTFWEHVSVSTRKLLVSE